MSIFFLFLHKNRFCGYSLELPRWGNSNEYPQHMFSWRNKKNINTFWLIKKVLSRAMWPNYILVKVNKETAMSYTETTKNQLQKLSCNIIIISMWLPLFFCSSVMNGLWDGGSLVGSSFRCSRLVDTWCPTPFIMGSCPGMGPLTCGAGWYEKALVGTLSVVSVWSSNCFRLQAKLSSGVGPLGSSLDIWNENNAFRHRSKSVL